MVKTNALRIMATSGADVKVYEVDVSDGKIDGVSVAAKVGKDPETVFKTLVTIGKTTGINVFVIPVEHELNLKKAAAAAGDKYIEMIKSRDLEPMTGYIHGGCSPVGMKKQFPTFIEETAEILGTFTVSAGRIGLQMELEPSELVRITGAVFADLV
jgi:Cys-tRNA(Pro)/Cys-tRNA(Cys) deacylase